MLDGKLDGKPVHVVGLETRSNSIRIPPSLSEPDPHWRFTDAAGHAHEPTMEDGRVRSYGTLVSVESEPYWCEDCRDEHTDQHYECPLCGEVIRPGTRRGRATWLPGLKEVHATIYGAPWTTEQVRLEVQSTVYVGQLLACTVTSGQPPWSQFVGQPAGR
jgi:hypothetical protein